MKKFVLTHNAVVGFHFYPNAPQFCSYLENKHRHVFVIRCKFQVSHNEREIEINEQQNRIESFLFTSFGNPCDFGAMSCESIAQVLMEHFAHIMECEVLEDNYGGASLTR